MYKGMKMVYHTVANTDKDDVKYDMQRQDEVANMFAGERYQSTGMNTSVVSDGKLTMNPDNTINQV